MAGVMVPTNHLRWNQNLGDHRYRGKPQRLEQLWKEVPGCAGDQVRNPKREWRPMPMVHEGWDENDWSKPLEER